MVQVHPTLILGYFVWFSWLVWGLDTIPNLGIGQCSQQYATQITSLQNSKSKYIIHLGRFDTILVNRGNYCLEIMQTCALKLVVRQMSFFLLATPFLLLHIAWPLKLSTMPCPYTACVMPLRNLNVYHSQRGEINAGKEEMLKLAGRQETMRWTGKAAGAI